MDIFEKHNIKKTKNRKIIYEYLSNLNVPINCDNLYKLISKNYEINRATIYRNLNLLSELKLIDKVIRQDGVAYFSISKTDHSHYMICDLCDSQFEIPECPLDIHSLESIIDNGFKLTGHILEIHGICKECQQKDKVSNSKVGEIDVL